MRRIGPSLLAQHSSQPLLDQNQTALGSRKHGQEATVACLRSNQAEISSCMMPSDTGSRLTIVLVAVQLLITRAASCSSEIKNQSNPMKSIYPETKISTAIFVSTSKPGGRVDMFDETEPDSYKNDFALLLKVNKPEGDTREASKDMREILLGQMVDYEAGKNIKIGGPNDFLPSANELNMNFLQLFDELWRVKNNIMHNLVALEYFSIPKRGNLTESTTEKPDLGENQPSTASTKPDQSPKPNQDYEQLRPHEQNNTKVPNKRAPNRGGISSKIKSHPSFFVIVQRQAENMLRQIQIKVERALSRLRWPLAKRTPTQTTVVESNLDLAVDRLLGIPTGDAPELRRFRRQQSDQVDCTRLMPGQIDQCKATEASLSLGLNSSFPGTSSAIEDNCHKIRFLLGVCWPDQLHMIRNSLSSRNETMLNSTDFPLPSSGQSDYVASSCGVESSLDKLVLDRISWMWLNLCMDKRFRQDYVNNLKCLSLWSQDRARLVCNNEYKRMQVTGSKDSSVDKGQSQMMMDSELESKTICCTFDQFLRCVHRQAVRDCNRIGGQFVVNFMSRVNSEDMKYMCNNEPRSSSKVTQTRQSGNTRGRLGTQKVLAGPGNNQRQERGPFIESGYCAESRVSVALQVASEESGSDRYKSQARANSSSNGSRAPNGARNNSRQGTGSNQNLDYSKIWGVSSGCRSLWDGIKILYGPTFMLVNIMLSWHVISNLAMQKSQDGYKIMLAF